MDLSPFKLTEYEKQSSTWERVKAHLEERLLILRERNDGLMSENDRNILLGSIRTIKEILAWETPDPKINQ